MAKVAQAEDVAAADAADRIAVVAVAVMEAAVVTAAVAAAVAAGAAAGAVEQPRIPVSKYQGLEKKRSAILTMSGIR